MPATTAVRLLLIAGTLVPAIGASPAAAQLPLPSSTTTTTEATTTTTSTTEPEGTTTTTTAAPSSTTTSSTPSTTSSSTSTTAPAEELDALTGGALGISVPPTAEAAGSIGSTASAALGPVTVTDERTGLVAGWTATVAATEFVHESGATGTAIPAGAVSYWSGPATATAGDAMFSPGQPTAGAAQPLDQPRVAFSAVTTSGGSSATWNPTVALAPPATAVSGRYQGTITHSVA